jgi:hypothetical protein
MSCRSAIGARSTSIGAPAAMVEASGFIWAISGQTAAAAPDGGHGAGCDIKKIAARAMRRRRRRHDPKPFPLFAGRSIPDRAANRAQGVVSPAPRLRGRKSNQRRPPKKAKQCHSERFY